MACSGEWICGHLAARTMLHNRQIEKLLQFKCTLNSLAERLLVPFLFFITSADADVALCCCCR